jgi:RNA-directed DNA polymerase
LDKRPTTDNGCGPSVVPHWLDDGSLPRKLSSLRHKLWQKAKAEPKFRFYTLYAHLSRPDVLREAYRRQRANKDKPGVDGASFKDIEDAAGGVDAFLDGLAQQLRSRQYRPQPVRRTYIPKADGKLRPLGIPTIADRVVQAAAVLILEPVFEADFHDCSYGYRPGRSAHDALEEIRGHLARGLCAIYDADLKGYFDSIPHDKLMACLAMRIADRQMLKLIRMWLQTPVVELHKDKGGKPAVHRSDKGTPQGGVISPLLANIYLHWFDHVFHRSDGPAQWAKAKLVRFADDFVVLSRAIKRPLWSFIEEKIEMWMGLEINREKTRVVQLSSKGGQLNFLGYSYRFYRDRFGRNKNYLHMQASKDAVRRERNAIAQMTSSRNCFKPLRMLVDELNRQQRGWARYFSLGHPRHSYRQINSYTRWRLERWCRRRSQRSHRPRGQQTYHQMFADLGLVYLRTPRPNA